MSAATHTVSGLARNTALPPASLRRFAWAVVFYNVLVIAWGALVRATGSGAGCGNHWPLCNGQVVPISPRIETVIEFTHRCMTGVSTLAVLGLLVWTFRGTIKGQAARLFATVSMLLLLNEAFLGALLVKLGYVTGNQSIGRVIVLSIHLSNTLLLLGFLTLTARFLSTERKRTQLGFKVRDAGLVLMGLIATLVVGVSGSLAALGDTLFPAANLRAALAQDFSPTSSWLLRLRWVHPASALVAAAVVAWMLMKAHRKDLQWRWVAALLAVQFGLGLVDVLLLAPAWMQLLHLIGADLYWIALLILAADLVWPKQTADQYSL